MPGNNNNKNSLGFSKNLSDIAKTLAHLSYVESGFFPLCPLYTLNEQMEDSGGIVFARDSEIDALTRAFPRSLELREPALALSAAKMDVLPSSLGVLPPSLETPRLLLALELTRWRVGRQKEHPSRAVLDSIDLKLDRTEALVRVEMVSILARADRQEKRKRAETSTKEDSVGVEDFWRG